MNNIKRLREQRNMTQAELAQRLGTTQQKISYIELTRRRLSLMDAKKIAAALGCNVDDIECA